MASHSILAMLANDGNGTRRGAIRNRVLMVATLTTPTKSTGVRIRDVSSTGARVEGTDLPSRGSTVVLTRGSFEAFGQIVWVGDGLVGIAFDEHLPDDALMASLRGLPEPAPEPSPYRRGGFDRDPNPPRLSTGDGWLRAIPGRA